ncbi:hypothetical protein [Calothrix sp. PCC 6303]|uniref:hypothetical protein n=1 Tax=Calothrix sp. PCC 6303 TaxID=1170562 RepID=UPI0002A04C09|nr:hypothetical protein [Calothrix sp. PCC 6303]AFZ03517.1 hypothetical protein Cal6303_4617 [Calothrix sp. PCC 6303]
MAYLTTKTFKSLVSIATCSLAFTLGSTASTFAASQSIKAESLTSVPAKVGNSSTLIAQATNMTGAWNCNDGGVYFIRQVGNQIWWYGQSSDGGQTWSNVFQGTITGSRIVGSWADVPKGSIRGYGEMTLRISGGRIQKISGGQNFGGSVWSR